MTGELEVWLRRPPKYEVFSLNSIAMETYGNPYWILPTLARARVADMFDARLRYYNNVNRPSRLLNNHDQSTLRTDPRCPRPFRLFRQKRGDKW